MSQAEWAEYKTLVKMVEGDDLLHPEATRSLEHGVRADGLSFAEEFQRIFLDDSGKQDAEKNRRRFRTPFQLETDKITASPFFQRLAMKTQLFVGTGQHVSIYSRLAHSLGVSYLARSLAQKLKLNAQLAEGIALAHDIGQPAFAHKGEETLQEWLKTLIERGKNEKAGDEKVKDEKVKNEEGKKEERKLDPATFAAMKKTCFTLRKDKEEKDGKIFQHGTQGVRLLLRFKEAERFSRQLLYGIWRHSRKVETEDDKDETFEYEDVVSGHTVSLIGKRDCSPELRLVRYVDDVVVVVKDIMSCKMQGSLSGKDHSTLLGTLDNYPLAREAFKDALDAPDADGTALYTFFSECPIGVYGEEDHGKTDEMATSIKKGTIKFKVYNDGPAPYDGPMVLEHFRKHYMKVHLYPEAALKRADALCQSRIAGAADFYFVETEALRQDCESLVRYGFCFPRNFELLKKPNTDEKVKKIYDATNVIDFLALLTDFEFHRLETSESLGESSWPKIKK